MGRLCAIGAAIKRSLCQGSGGRPPGAVNRNTAELKALAVKSAPHAIAELVRLALHAKNESVQVAACKELLDRAIGKAVQPHTGEGGEGPVVVQVITGVPRAIVEN
jgi:hypothetical protein